MIAFNAIHAEITWTISDDGTLTILGTNMPDYKYYYDVPWYSQRETIKKVVIKKGVTNIGSHAFHDCPGLTSIIIPNSVTSIGVYAFYNCSGLTSITLPNSVTSIGRSAFYDCSGLTSIDIPNSVTNIEDYAFYQCSGLISVTIPSSVKTIGNEAFYGCNNITSIALGVLFTDFNSSNITSLIILDGLTSIEEGRFYGFRKLTSIKVEEANKYYDSRNNCNAIIEKKSNTLIAGCKNSIIPNSLTRIGSSAFYGCTGLSSVTIPNTVTSIGDFAFYGCKDLTSVSIGNSVMSIEKSTFALCSGLTSIDIPNSVTNIGEYSFNGCSGLTSITIPNSVTGIGSSAFGGCSGITSITIPNSVVNIDNYAFEYCQALKNLTIGNSVESIGKNAFYDCYNLQSITITNPNPPSCVSKETFTCSTKNVRDVYDVYNYTTLHIPMGSKDAYSSAQEWRYFNKVKEDMELNGNVYYAILTVKQGTTGYTEQPVKADETYTIYIGALGENKINAVTFNGEDVTDQVKDGYYTTPAIKAKSTLSISYEESNTTNVKEMSNPELKVTGNEGEINISGIDNPANVEVYTTDGRLVENRSSVSGDTRIQVKEDELYLIKVGKRTIKIAM